MKNHYQKAADEIVEVVKEIIEQGYEKKSVFKNGFTKR